MIEETVVVACGLFGKTGKEANCVPRRHKINTRSRCCGTLTCSAFNINGSSYVVYPSVRISNIESRIPVSKILTAPPM